GGGEIDSGRLAPRCETAATLIHLTGMAPSLKTKFPFTTLLLLPLGIPATTPPGGAVRTRASFAGGCFWCMDPPFENLDGVLKTTVGYTGGHTANPTYEEVSAGGTGHAESIEIEYDPAKISYAKLLDVFWHNVDPL